MYKTYPNRKFRYLEETGNISPCYESAIEYMKISYNKFILY